MCRAFALLISAAALASAAALLRKEDAIEVPWR